MLGSVCKLVSKAFFVIAALVFFGANGIGPLSIESVVAQEAEKKQKTRRVPSISEQVFKLLGKAQEAIDLKDYVEAERVVTEALQRKRRYNENELANIRNTLGYVYYLTERYGKAIEEYKIVVAQGEKIPEGLETTTLYTIAQLSYVEENYRDALKYMEIWITKAANPSAAPRFFLATVYYQMKDYVKAIEQMELGIKVAQDRGTTITEQNWSLLTFLYFEKEDWPNVIRVLEILVKEFPKREHWVRLAGVYGQEGREKEQLYTLEAAYTAGFFERRTDYTNLAGLLMQDEVPYRAAKVLVAGFENEALERDSDNLQSLGQAWQLSQEVYEAIPVYEEAAKLADDGKIYERLSYLYLESDNYDSCVAAADGALDKGGLRKVQAVQTVKGMCLYNNNKLRQARDAFSSCRREARRDEDTTSTRICAQWITFIDRERDRQQKLAEASGG
jgi:tetratricopeptide (TPR) repeat protein